jgi:hypothetical protein
MTMQMLSKTPAIVAAVAIGWAFSHPIDAHTSQPAAVAPQPRAVTRTLYSLSTELFAEWRPFVVGEAIRLTAHLTRTGGQFKPYTEGRVTLTLTVEKMTANAAADGPERPGVFRLNVTPTKAGTGRIVIDVTAATGAEHFVIDDVPVYADLQAAMAVQSPVETGLVSYAKERSWEEAFATAPVIAHFGGAARIITVPVTAIVHDGVATLVYVQHTPERFELREVTTRRTLGEAVEITSGLRESERIIVRGANKMPRQ